MSRAGGEEKKREAKAGRQRRGNGRANTQAWALEKQRGRACVSEREPRARGSLESLERRERESREARERGREGGREGGRGERGSLESLEREGEREGEGERVSE